MSNIIKVTPTEVSVIKTGTKDGRKWTLSKVRNEDGTYYATFDEFAIGITVDVETEEKEVEKNGKTYKNVSIKKLRAPKTEYALKKDVQEMWMAFEDLKSRVMHLEVKQSMEEKNPNEEIDINNINEEIPF